MRPISPIPYPLIHTTRPHYFFHITEWLTFLYFKSESFIRNYAKLNYAKLNYAKLNYAKLNYAKLNYAKLNYAKLNYVKLNYAKLILIVWIPLAAEAEFDIFWVLSTVEVVGGQ